MTPEHGYGEREKQQRSSEFKKRAGGERGRQFSGSSQGQGSKQGQNQGGWKKPNTFRDKKDSGEYRNRDRGRANYSAYGKDKDDDREEQRRSPQPRRNNRDSDLSKIREQQPDKIVIMKKLEKEQKVMKKKSEEKRKVQNSRPVPKQKRSQNINYTRQYENGMYEDYEEWYDEF